MIFDRRKEYDDEKEVKGGVTNGGFMDLTLTPQNVAIFIVFVVVLVILYKTVKFVAKLLAIASLSFSFPWIVKILNLPIPVDATIEVGVKFMLLGIGVFLVYEFWHITKKILEIILLPFKLLWKFIKRD